MRRKKSIPVEEFWNSDEPKLFRFHSNSQYAEIQKFKKWILNHISENIDKPSYDEQVDAELGPMEDRNDYKKSYKNDSDSPVLKVFRSQLHKGDKKWKPQTDLDYDFKPAEKLGEEYALEGTIGIVD